MIAKWQEKSYPWVSTIIVNICKNSVMVFFPNKLITFISPPFSRSFNQKSLYQIPTYEIDRILSVIADKTITPFLKNQVQLIFGVVAKWSELIFGVGAKWSEVINSGITLLCLKAIRLNIPSNQGRAGLGQNKYKPFINL